MSLLDFFRPNLLVDVFMSIKYFLPTIFNVDGLRWWRGPPQRFQMVIEMDKTVCELNLDLGWALIVEFWVGQYKMFGAMAFKCKCKFSEKNSKKPFS